jgi:hypothetical protein
LNRFCSGYVPVLVVLSTVAPAGPASICIAALLLPASTMACCHCLLQLDLPYNTVSPIVLPQKVFSLDESYFPWAALCMYICILLRLDFVYYLAAI